jgi:hypothetical protein
MAPRETTTTHLGRARAEEHPETGLRLLDPTTSTSPSLQVMSLTASSQVLPLPICADSGWEALTGIGARLAIGDAAELTQSAGLRRNSWLRGELTIPPSPRPVCQASRYTRPPTRRTRISR